MQSEYKQWVVDFLMSFKTGSSDPQKHIHPDYIQHNLRVADKLEGLQMLLAAIPAGSATAAIHRIFQDGDFVFTHSLYKLNGGERVGFDIFRFEGSKIVEHWDNLQAFETLPNASGHFMLDGPTEATDLDKTEANRALLDRYMRDVLQGNRERLPAYFDGFKYIQHNPWVSDGLQGLAKGLQELSAQGKAVKYQQVHRILAEGDFVLVVAEGTFGPVTTAYYDLYRMEDGKIAEHWDTLETMPPAADWKNTNGKF